MPSRSTVTSAVARGHGDCTRMRAVSPGFQVFRSGVSSMRLPFGTPRRRAGPERVEVDLGARRAGRARRARSRAGCSSRRRAAESAATLAGRGRDRPLARRDLAPLPDRIRRIVGRRVGTHCSRTSDTVTGTSARALPDRSTATMPTVVPAFGVDEHRRPRHRDVDRRRVHDERGAVRDVLAGHALDVALERVRIRGVARGFGRQCDGRRGRRRQAARSSPERTDSSGRRSARVGAGSRTRTDPPGYRSRIAAGALLDQVASEPPAHGPRRRAGRRTGISRSTAPLQRGAQHRRIAGERRVDAEVGAAERGDEKRCRRRPVTHIRGSSTHRRDPARREYRPSAPSAGTRHVHSTLLQRFTVIRPPIDLAVAAVAHDDLERGACRHKAHAAGVSSRSTALTCTSSPTL